MQQDIEDATPFLRGLARYGVPLLILIFYVTATLFFRYTPESSFGTILNVKDSNPDSLWALLLSLATVFKVDLLLASKVFSLVFSCAAILFTYLIANEVLHDHLLSFCVALTLSMQAWLLQLAPSGSGMCFTMFLSLGVIFFLLRNEYIIAAVFAGLAMLSGWETVGLSGVLLADIYLNSVDKRRAIRVIGGVVLILLGILLPWVLYSIHAGRAIVPSLHDSVDVVSTQWKVLAGTYVLAGLSLCGIVVMVVRDRGALRFHAPVLLWVALTLLLDDKHVWAITVPVIVVYGFFGLRKVLEGFAPPLFIHVVAVFLATLLLVHHQFIAFPQTQQVIAETVVQTEELKAIGLWLRTNVGDDESIAAPGKHENALRFYAEKRVGEANARFIVSEAGQVSGGDMAFDPGKENVEMLGSSVHYRIWRRK